MIVGQQCEFQNILIILSFCVLINYRGYIKLQWDEKKKTYHYTVSFKCMR